MSARTRKKRPETLVPCALCGYPLGESGESTISPLPGEAPRASETPCPHCRRSPHDESLREPLRGPVTGILAGTVAVPRGLYYLFSTPRVLRWILPPLLVTSVLLFLVLLWTFGLIDAYLEARTEGEFAFEGEWGWLAGLPEGFGWLKSGWNGIVGAVEWITNLSIGLLTSKTVRFAGWFLVGSLITWYLFSIAYEALAGPFLDEIQARLESRWFGEDPRSRLERPNDIPPERCVRLSSVAGGVPLAVLVAAFLVPGLPWWSALVALLASTAAAVAYDRRYGTWLLWVARIESGALWASLQASVVTGLMILLALPLYFVPAVGYFLFAFVCGFGTAVGMLDIPMERRGWKISMRLRFILGNLPALVCFGMVAGFLLAVPIVGPILMVPSASIGGLWLLCRLDKSRLARPHA